MPANPKPLNTRPIIKKKIKKINRWQSDRFMRVDPSWRAPRGIDSRFRRRFKGTGPQPGIGYGSNKKTRGLLPNGFYKFTVSRVQDLELLLMHNRKYCAEIAHDVSRQNRRAILDRAEQLNVRVLNGKAKMRDEEA
ncbi:60S ribosomal protein L32 [Hondaea fermentalgiana]|uniref:60S ribosomal protein L32 n=1 Tax=Hondaea fermentalgiana TaxID=2315210 RepID=A0A2R5G5A1_9STRA|nr:60S ribosomal protein L32 [Hondaea fermentalgiana]|eukprot:GBG26206.1 60S ribosomal protein L32 [Hondaea fermentalgiana]